MKAETKQHLRESIGLTLLYLFIAWLAFLSYVDPDRAQRAAVCRAAGGEFYLQTNAHGYGEPDKMLCRMPCPRPQPEQPAP